MKRSLGRRSSSRNGPHPMVFTNFESVRKEKKSGIPLRRATSTDRAIPALVTPHAFNRTMATPKSRRSMSEDRNSMAYNVRSCFAGGSERQSRATIVSTNSNRLSSYGPSRKKDNRPIEDKEWQLTTQRKIETFLLEDEEGRELIPTYTIKPINLKIFIDIINLMLKKLFATPDMSSINKLNYITELPFMMKKLGYRGKIEKSWLITVNTVRSWGHCLACLDFLVTCVTSQINLDAMTMMFPDNNSEEDDIWNYKILLPYFQKSYEFSRSNYPQYEEVQEQLDCEIIEQHISNDNVFERNQSLVNAIKKAHHEMEVMKSQVETVRQSLKELDEKYSFSKDEKSKCEEYIQKLTHILKETELKLESRDKHRGKLIEDLERKQQAKSKLESFINKDSSHGHPAELKKSRDSIQREIEQGTAYIAKFEELLQKNSLEFLSRKKQFDDLIKKYNLTIMEYLSYGLENAMLDGKKTEVEEMCQDLEVVHNAIIDAKKSLRSHSNSNSLKLFAETREELESLENQKSEKESIMMELYDKMNKAIKEKEESCSILKDKVTSVTDKLKKLKCDSDAGNLQLAIAEKKERAEKMSKQLSYLRNNAVMVVQECTQNLCEHVEKHKELDMEFKKQVEELQSLFQKQLQ